MTNIEDFKNTILVIAEKPSVARAIALGLNSKYQLIKQSSCSAYAVVFQNKTYLVTGIRGHLQQIDFDQKEGEKVNDIDVMCEGKLKTIMCHDSDKLVSDLKSLKKTVIEIILALDDDREGERIGFELMELLGPFKYSRVRLFSLTPEEVQAKISTPSIPDKNLNAAAESRAELDLKIGYAFSRLINRAGKAAKIDKLSYGPCQTTTLGIITAEFASLQLLANMNFQLEDVPFSIRVPKSDSQKYGKQLKLKVAVKETAKAIIHAPLPLNTATMLKLASASLQMSPEETMKAAENIYLQKLITYPRTESTIYLKEKEADYRRVFDQIKGEQKSDNTFQYSAQIGENCGDHLPITPTGAQIPQNSNLTPTELRLFTLIQGYFVLSFSGDTVAKQVELGFSNSLLNLQFKKNAYDDYDNNWVFQLISKQFKMIHPHFKTLIDQLQTLHKMPKFKQSDVSIDIDFQDIKNPYIEETQAIDYMTKYQIGTDATMASHLQALLDKNLVSIKSDNNLRYYVPSQSAIKLINALKQSNPQLIAPEIRQKMEKGLKLVASGAVSKEKFVLDQLEQYRAIHADLQKNLDIFKIALI